MFIKEMRRVKTKKKNDKGKVISEGEYAEEIREEELEPLSHSQEKIHVWYSSFDKPSKRLMKNKI